MHSHSLTQIREDEVPGLYDVADVIVTTGTLRDLFDRLKVAIEGSPGRLTSPDVRQSLDRIHHLILRMVGSMDGEWKPIDSWGTVSVPARSLTPATVELLSRLGLGLPQAGDPDRSEQSLCPHTLCLELPRKIADLSKERVPWQEPPTAHFLTSPQSAPAAPPATGSSGSSMLATASELFGAPVTGQPGGPLDPLDPCVSGCVRTGGRAQGQRWTQDSDCSTGNSEIGEEGEDDDDVRDMARRRQRSRRQRHGERVGMVSQACLGSAA